MTDATISKSLGQESSAPYTAEYASRAGVVALVFEWEDLESKSTQMADVETSWKWSMRIPDFTPRRDTISRLSLNIPTLTHGDLDVRKGDGSAVEGATVVLAD